MRRRIKSGAELEADKMMLARFWSKVSVCKNDRGCWVWQGSLCQSGYGVFHFGAAHRLSYEFFNGPIGDGLVVRHKCDNPACCNPDHMLLGTHADNRDDCVSRGRNAKGEGHGRAKLTDADVLKIRSEPAGRTHSAIARDYGVSRSIVTRILLGTHR